MKTNNILLGLATTMLMACGSGSSNSTAEPAKKIATQKPQNTKKKQLAKTIPAAPIMTESDTTAKSAIVNSKDIAFLDKKISVDDKNRLIIKDADASLKGGDGLTYKQYLDPSQKISVVLIDPVMWGWKYQTYGEVFDRQGFKGYINVGNPYDPSEAQTINASYSGYSEGRISNGEMIGGSMNAQLSWGTNSKTLNIDIGKPTVSGKADEDHSDLEFKRNLTWNSKSKAFEGPGIVARLYGTATEIGGTFNHSVAINKKTTMSVPTEVTDKEGKTKIENKDKVVEHHHNGIYQGVFGGKASIINKH